MFSVSQTKPKGVMLCAFSRFSRTSRSKYNRRPVVLASRPVHPRLATAHRIK